jgi:hypothetical protein
VATTNGTATTFQKVLDNSPVVANSVSVSDGTYTWSQSAGSSNEDQFGGAYSTSLRRVTVNYYNGAPATGRTIAATYRYGTSGITGALSSGAEHWMAVSVDGTTQGTRQRVLAVPFAMHASKSDIAQVADRSLIADTATTAKSLETQIKQWRPSVLSANGETARPPSYTIPYTSYYNDEFRAVIPCHITKITTIKIKGSMSGSSPWVRVAILGGNSTVNWEKTFTNTAFDEVNSISIDLNQNYPCRIQVSGSGYTINDLMLSYQE